MYTLTLEIIQKEIAAIFQKKKKKNNKIASLYQK